MRKRLILAAIAMVIFGAIGTTAAEELTWITEESIGFVLPEGFEVKEEKSFAVLTHPDFPENTVTIIGPEKLTGPGQFKASVGHLIQAVSKGKGMPYVTGMESDEKEGNFEESFTGVYALPNEDAPQWLVLATSGRISDYCVTILLIANDKEFIQICRPIFPSLEVDEEVAAEMATE